MAKTFTPKHIVQAVAKNAKAKAEAELAARRAEEAARKKEEEKARKEREPHVQKLLAEVRETGIKKQFCGVRITIFEHNIDDSVSTDVRKEAKQQLEDSGWDVTHEDEGFGEFFRLKKSKSSSNCWLRKIFRSVFKLFGR